MPIGADQWRAVTGLNNASRRPRQLGLKQRFMQQRSQYGGSEELSDHPEAESINQDTPSTTGRARTKKPGVRKRSKQKDNCVRENGDSGSDTMERHACTEKGQFKQSGGCPESDSNSPIWRWGIGSLFTFQCLVTLAVWLAVISWSFLWDSNAVSVQGATVVGSISNETCIITPGVFGPSSVMGVQLLQSFISVVVMLLLLLSGDVETNPGPTDYLTLTNLREVNNVLFDIRAKWDKLGLQLCVHPGTMDAINRKHKDASDCLLDMLKDWISKGEASWEQLVAALREKSVGESVLAGKIEEEHCLLGKRPCHVQSDVPVSKRHCSENGHVDDGYITAYATTLKTKYSEQTLPAEGMVKHSTKVCRLAMIKKEKVSRKEVRDEFVQQTISGKVDDILHMKTPVELEDIFKDVPEDRKLVLIEGAPGAGKSSLSLNICKKWSEGELFQEFKAVILVHLRDPLVQKAQTLADRLPYCDNSQNVASAIMSTRGKGILWVLDGWDEFPDQLKKDEKSFVRNLVLHPNHDSSVIVTSRPTSSVDLHPLVSKRIEVLGFTSDELKEYFKERLDGDSKSVEILLKKIKDLPEVDSSCYLPLYAAFIADTFVLKKELPATQYGIFETIVIKCISRHQIKQGKKRVESLDELPVDLKACFDAICELAYCGILESKVIFTESDLPACFKPLDLLQEVESMLAFQGSSKTYNFLHLHLQEFLAAQHFATKPPRDHQWLFRGFMDDERCLPMLTFYAAKTKLHTPGITNFLSSHFLEANIRKILFILRCICETEDPSLCKPIYEVLKEKYLFLFHHFDLTGCYLLGCFISLSSRADIGDHIKIDLNTLVGEKEFCMFMKGLLRFSKDPVLSTLDIHFSQPKSDESIILFNQLLRDTPLVSSLKLSRLWTKPMIKTILLEGVRYSTSLYKLELDDVRTCHNRYKCDDEGTIGYSLEQIFHSSALADLSIYKASDMDFKRIANGLPCSKTLKKLHFVDCITPEGVKLLSESLHTNCSIESLTLSSNELDDEGTQFIATALCVNHTLKSLTLSSYEIGDEGAKSIAHALRGDNSTLTSLILKDCGVTATVSSFLLDVFQRGVLNTLVITTYQRWAVPNIVVDFPATVRMLEISVNDKGATSLKGVLENRDLSLETLKVCLDKSPRNDFCVIVNTLQENNFLKYLHIKNCEITVKGLNSLGKALAENNTLKEVFIDGVLVSGTHTSNYFTSCLERNTSLEKLRLPYSPDSFNTKNLEKQVNIARDKVLAPSKLLVRTPVVNYASDCLFSQPQPLQLLTSHPVTSFSSMSQVHPPLGSPLTQVHPPLVSPLTQVHSQTGSPLTPVHPPLVSPLTQVHSQTGSPFTPVHPPLGSPLTQVHSQTGSPLTPVHPPFGSPLTQVHPPLGSPLTQVHPLHLWSLLSQVHSQLGESLTQVHSLQLESAVLQHPIQRSLSNSESHTQDLGPSHNNLTHNFQSS